MNWEQTIQHVRKLPEYAFLVENAYLCEDLVKNVEKFKTSQEFIETINIFKTYVPAAKKILDIGCGNGISAVAFSLTGYHVDAIEPDPSETVGAGAVRYLKAHYNLENLSVEQNFAEELKLLPEQYDIVYARQCMHHAYDLDKFLKECARVLKKGGLLITVRDHVIFDTKDKEWFLENHPLQKFYGGENAFTPDEYKQAMKSAGLQVEKELTFFDSPINNFPMKPEEMSYWKKSYRNYLIGKTGLKIGILKRAGFLIGLYVNLFKDKNAWKEVERTIPGRMYSYICSKP